MYLSSWGMIAFNLNWALDHGKNDLSFEEVYEGIEKNDLFEVLKNRYPNTFDFSLITETDKLQKAYRTLSDIAGGLEGRERRKVGVENSGMNLLLAFVIEAMQQGFWEEV